MYVMLIFLNQLEVASDCSLQSSDDESSRTRMLMTSFSNSDGGLDHHFSFTKGMKTKGREKADRENHKY